MSNDKKVSAVWKGTPLDSLETSFNKPLIPDVKPSNSHAVLIKLPIVEGRVPEPYPIVGDIIDESNDDYVLLPFSSKCVQTVSKNEKKKKWEIVIESLQNNITNSEQLVSAIHLYNTKCIKRWNFTALHTFLNENCDEYENELFFGSLLPKMISLALQLPNLVTGKIPLLCQNVNQSITLSQIQVASLLANAFFCTFPVRINVEKKNRDETYPDINFNHLFNYTEETRAASVQEKLKCLINYFRRVTDKAPDGVITYSRHVIRENSLPDWNNSKHTFTRIHVTKSGTIEDDGYGMLQMDFADKFVGGGIIAGGCVQEEIRFAICPELIISRLFTQRLGAREVLVITGCERYNSYKEYGKSFKFDGNFIDQTPRDKYGRKHCTVIAVDALSFSRNPMAQYTGTNILRELNKLYVGFSWGKIRESDVVSAIASGNWGCGVFRGDVHLKSLLQLMAVSQVGRDLIYFTFGNEKTTKSIFEMHSLLKDKQQTVGDVWKMISKFSEEEHYKRCSIKKFIHEQLVNPKKGNVFHIRKEENSQKTVDEEQVNNSMEKLDQSFLSSEQLAKTLKIVDDLCSAQNVTLNTENKQGESKTLNFKKKEERMINFKSKTVVDKQKESWNKLKESKKDFHKSVNRCNILDRLEEQDDFAKLIKKADHNRINNSPTNRGTYGESVEFSYLKKMYGHGNNKTEISEDKAGKYYEEVKTENEKEKEVTIAVNGNVIDNQEKEMKIEEKNFSLDVWRGINKSKKNKKIIPFIDKNENLSNRINEENVGEIKGKEITTNQEIGQITKKRKISDYFQTTPKSEKHKIKTSKYFSKSEK